MHYDGSLLFDTKIDQKGFTSGLSSLGKAAGAGLAAVTASLAAASGAAIAVGSDFEEAMSQVAAVSGAAGADLDALSQKAKEMGAATKFSASQAAEAFNYMAMAGWKTEEMLDGIEGVMNLAAASGENLGTVSDIVTDAITAFGLSAQDSGHFADVLAAASSNANTNVSMMGATFKYVAPVAGAMKYSIEDTAVAIGLMANAGIKGEQAGTSLRAILTRLVDPPKEAADAMRQLGVTVTEADGSMKPLNEVIGQLREKFSGLSESQQASLASSLAGTEAMSGLLAIVNASDSDFEKLTEAIGGADGAAAKMAETMQDNLKGQLTILKSGLEGVGITAYEKFEKPLKEAVKAAIDQVANLNKEMSQGKLSGSMEKLGKSLGKLVQSLSKFVTGALPKLINGAAILIRHAGKILTAVVAIKAAMLAWKAGQVIAAAAMAWKAATAAVLAHEAANRLAMVTSLGATTAMQTGAALLTGKITLATAAQWAWNAAMSANPIGIVLIAVTALGAGIAALVLHYKDQVTEIDTLNQKLAEEKQSWYDLQQARLETQESSVGEIDHVQRLWRELQTLVDENGRVFGCKEGFKFITDQINDLMPDTIKWIGKERIAYEDSKKAIEDLMETKRAQAILDSYEPEYKKALVEYQDKQLEQAELALEIAKEQARWDEVVAKQGEKFAYENLSAWKDSLDEKKKLYAENEELLLHQYEIINFVEKGTAAILSGNAEGIKKINEGVGESFKTATDASIEELRRQAEEFRVHAALMRQHLEEGWPGMTEDMVREAEKMAVKATVEYNKVAEAIAEGLTEGIKENAQTPVKETENMMDKMLNAAKKALGIHSPSTVFRDMIGRNMAAGLEIGFEEEMGKAAKRMETAVKLETVRFAASISAQKSIESASIGVKQSGKAAPVYQDNRQYTFKVDDIGTYVQIEQRMKQERMSYRMGYVRG